MLQERRFAYAVAGVLVAVAAGLAAITATSALGNGDESVSGDALRRASEAALAHTGGGHITDAEFDDGHYELEVRLDDGREADLTLDRNFVVVWSEDDDAGWSVDSLPPGRGSGSEPIPSDALATAIESALAYTGGGHVTDGSFDDGRYEVEIRLDDGKKVDLTLDGDFVVIWSEGDGQLPESSSTVAGDADAAVNAFAKASDAALAYVGSGRVTSVETDDGGSRYEVEISLNDGTEVDVRLDADLTVISSERDMWE